MFTCPHCSQRGVGFFDKLLSTPLFPASCKHCRQRSTKGGGIVWGQLALAATYLSVARHVPRNDQLPTVEVLVVLIIVAVGQLAPLKRCG